MKNTVESNTQFIAYNIPGIPAYGQRGSVGPTGNPGSSIYFYPGSITENDNTTKKYLINCIRTGNEFSNNNKYLNSSKSIKNIKYYNNDLILDINGYLWKIFIKYSEATGRETDLNYATIDFSRLNNILCSETFISDITIKNVTIWDKDKDDTFNYNRKNEDIINTIPKKITNKLYQYYRDTVNISDTKTDYNYYYGNWYKIIITFKTNQDYKNYICKCSIILPSGYTIENIGIDNTKRTIEQNILTTWIFIDNRYLYSEYVRPDNEDVMKAIKTTINYKSGKENNEDSIKTAQQFGEFLSTYCKICIEIIDKQSGYIYRYNKKLPSSNISN